MDSAYTPAGYCTRCGYPTGIGVCSECGKHNECVHRLNLRGRRRRLYRRVLALLAVAALVPGLWFGGRYAIHEYWPAWHLRRIADGRGRWSDAAQEIIRARWSRWWQIERPKGVERRARIVAEIERLGEHEWAGVYSHTFGRISLAPHNGYTWEIAPLAPFGIMMHGDVVRATEDRIIVKPSADPALNPSEIDTEFIRVRWGDMQCVVRVGDMIEFCNEVNAGRSYPPIALHARSAVHPLNWNLPSTLPKVPADYQKYLLQEPIKGEIVHVGKPVRVPTGRSPKGNYFIRVPATINVGSRTGIQIGMKLYAPFHRRRIGYARVKSVQTESSGVLFQYLFDQGEDYNQRVNAVKVGLKLSTRQETGF
ncbi:MAG: hypothetical protein IH986_02195 [Planctomycetes bacterium]|nr:hypothetical protein [Planctomycetota bacterium]